MSKYTHIIWDWNGTLKDDAHLCVDIISDILEKRQLARLSMARYQEIFGFPVRDYYAKAGLDFSIEPYETLATEFIVEYNARSEECPLQPHATEIIPKCAALGYKQSVLSAREQQPLDEILHFYDLRKYFERVVGLSDHYANSKVENGKKLVAEMETNPNNIVMIGDTLHDFEVAQAIGVDCILYAGGHQSKARLQACGVPVIEKLTELLPLIENALPLP